MKQFLGGKVTLFGGDSREVLKQFPDNSIDSILTDPPYALVSIVKRFGGANAAPAKEYEGKSGAYRRASAGFMGKQWDTGEVAFDPEFWAECLRVLKPGGHMLSFGGTRTFHRMACAIEDAGFEIRDMMQWLYGCLSEDTEIVTKRGIISYDAIEPTDQILCYDKHTKEYSYQTVEDIFVYRVEDTAYRIQSNYTDQIVSRNHRCLVERGGREVFVLAEDLQETEMLPILEDLPSLQQALSSLDERAGNEEQGMFQGMSWSPYIDQTFWQWKTRATSFWKDTSFLHSLREIILPQQEIYFACEATDVQQTLQRSRSRSGMENTCLQRTRKLDREFQEKIDRKDDGFYQSCMEGRDHIQASQRKSQGSKICQMSGQLPSDDSEGWVCDGTSSYDGTNSWSSLNQSGGGSPYQSRSFGQSNREPDVVSKQRRTQGLREWEGHRTTLATVSSIEYKGVIWCVKVPTGSFVAVRNGKAFVTGNSGFPKSHDVSKGIDKAAGAEREVVATIKKTPSAGSANMNEGWVRPWAEGKTTMDITAPATAAARQWEGWGTSLKPANEPICLARKPLSEKTVAANVLKWGTGALNIDGCRVATNETITATRNIALGSSSGGVYSAATVPGVYVQKDGGRWPANVVTDGSDEVVGMFPNSKDGVATGHNRSGASGNKVYGKRNADTKDVGYGGSGSAARFFYAAKANKKDRAGSKHPTVKPINLLRYLARLITPPGGMILDPFAGSGTTGEAAYMEGFEAVLIEREEEYQNDITKRFLNLDNLFDRSDDGSDQADDEVERTG